MSDRRWSRDSSYAWCRRETRRAASSFHWSFHVLPRAKRRAMYALYAFARVADDLVDVEQPAGQRRSALGSWRRAFTASLREEFLHPLFPALHDAMHRFRIPTQLFYDILDGVALDIEHRPPESLSDLIGYCDRVASSVGLACLHVWGTNSEQAFEPARRCGWAFQLTNILRDLAEDARRGRIYLPLCDLRDHQLSPEQWRAEDWSPRHAALFRFELQRAEHWFAEGQTTRDYLSRDGRRAFDLMFQRYRLLLREISRQQNPFQCGRARIAITSKVSILLSALLGRTPVPAATHNAERRAGALAGQGSGPGPSGITLRATCWDTSRSRPRVTIIGGGLAGLAAAVQLCQQNFAVTLLESRRQLGGRAGSFTLPDTGEDIDHCQHVGMVCCRQLIALLERVGITDLFRRDRQLTFVGPDGRFAMMAATPWLPAPFHLASSFLTAHYLSPFDRISIIRCIREMQSLDLRADGADESIADWLIRRGTSDQARRRFWNTVLVSALGETLENASLRAARKVIVDGFLSDRDGYELIVPRVPLGEIYRRIEDWLTARGATIHKAAMATDVCFGEGIARGVHWRDVAGTRCELSHEVADYVVVAVPWRRVKPLFRQAPPTLDRSLSRLEEIPSSPITSLHLWLDRPCLPIPHAVLVDRLSQWVFRGEDERRDSGDQQPRRYHHQVVISAFRTSEVDDKDALTRKVLDELSAIWPEFRAAILLDHRWVCQQEAVFSYRPGIDVLRPTQDTAVPNLFLAGDWTRTGWPATLEGAVRSGLIAADGILAALRKAECTTSITVAVS